MIALGASELTRARRNLVSGSEAGSEPGLSSTLLGSSSNQQCKTGFGLQFVVGKFRLRSTPLAFARVPLAKPSGFAASVTAHRRRSGAKVRSAVESTVVVSGSSPWYPANIRDEIGSPGGRNTSNGAPETDVP
jgi:hypothetical protein